MANLKNIKEVWPEQVWAHAHEEFESIKTMKPMEKGEGAIGKHFAQKEVLEAIRASPAKEARNYTCNLCWVEVPLGDLEEDLSEETTLGTLDNLVGKLWWDFKEERPRRANIYTWPTNMNILVILSSTTDMPEKGSWRCSGLKIAILGYWRLIALAKQSTKVDKVDWNYLRLLARNVPVDFKFADAKTPVFLSAAKAMEHIELLRDHFGMDCGRLVALVEKTLRHLKGMPTKKEVTHGDVVAYLRDNINWSDGKRVPDEAKVKQLIAIGAALRQAPAAKRAMLWATSVFGRNTIFEEYGKVLLLTQRCKTPADLTFVVEGIVAKMMRTNNEDKPSLREMGAKAGVIASLDFCHRLSTWLLNKFPIQASSNEQLALLNRATEVMKSPLVWNQEFPVETTGDLSWVGRLPTPMSAILNFFRGVLSESKNEMIKGMLGSPPQTGVTAEYFWNSSSNQTDRMNIQWEYDKHTGKAEEQQKPQQDEGAEGLAAESGEGADGGYARDTIDTLRDISTKARSKVKQ